MASVDKQSGVLKDELSAVAILSLLPPQVAKDVSSLHIFSSISSTNAYLLANAKAAASGMMICAADAQTRGYGRRDKRWISPPGNIYMSVAYKNAMSQAQNNWLSLAAAHGIAKTLLGFGAKNVQIKWPNDVYHEGRKLGGILIENKVGLTVIGIGVNVSMDSLKRVVAGEKNWSKVTALDKVLSDLPARNLIVARLLETVYHLAASPAWQKS